MRRLSTLIVDVIAPAMARTRISSSGRPGAAAPPACRSAAAAEGLDRAHFRGLVLGAVRIPDKSYHRSRLYRSQILQENMRWKALAEIYTIHSFAPFWNRTVLKAQFFV